MRTRLLEQLCGRGRLRPLVRPETAAAGGRLRARRHGTCPGNVSPVQIPNIVELHGRRVREAVADGAQVCGDRIGHTHFCPNREATRVAVEIGRWIQGRRQDNLETRQSLR